MPVSNINDNVCSHIPLEQAKAKEVLFLTEPGYVYGYKKVAVILTKNPVFATELTDLALKLEKAFKDKNVIDNNRSWAKTKTVLNFGSGVMEWRQHVNELNIQKEYIRSLSDSIVSKIQQNKDDIEILSLTEDSDDHIDKTHSYLSEYNLHNFFRDNCFKFI